MDRAIRSEFGLGKRNTVILSVILALFLALSVVIYERIYTDIRKDAEAQAVSSIANISELNADIITRALDNRKSLMQSFAVNLERVKITDIDSILPQIATYAKTYDFYTMGIMTEDEKLHLYDGRVIDASQQPITKTFHDGDFHISESTTPISGDPLNVNVFACPVKFDGKLQYVIIASYYSYKMAERMNTKSLDGKAYTFLMNSKGESAITPKNYNHEDYMGLMRYISYNRDIIPTDGGDIHFDYEGERYYAHYEPMNINDWSLMTCIRESDLYESADKLSFRVFIGMGLLWLMIMAGIAATLFSIYRSRRRLRQAVFYDELLGIANGQFLRVFFDKMPASSKKDLYYVTFDIDKFKEFNYIYGEDAGNNLLHFIVKVFKERIDKIYLFRYVSDHFVALINAEGNVDLRKKLDGVFSEMTRAIEAGEIQPFDISAGIRKIEEGDSFREVMSDALIAKQDVKGIQLQQYAFYDEKIRNRRMLYMEMESHFAAALRNNEFKVYYQPKFDMQTGRIVGSEALVRWVKPDGTIVSPGAFIPCFEASRQIIMLDLAMLEMVCEQMKDMEKQGLPIKKVSVNLSRVHLRQRGILPKIENALKRYDIDPSKLSFEITESALFEDSIPLKYIVDFLHDLGCGVDMDDYGIGVSGPNALAMNEFDVIKLDKSFIDGIGNERIESVIRSTVMLSKELGMEILAEGVEEKYQAERLVELGCVRAQGFYYSKPVPEAEYRRLLGIEKEKELQDKKAL